MFTQSDSRISRFYVKPCDAHPFKVVVSVQRENKGWDSCHVGGPLASEETAIPGSGMPHIVTDLRRMSLFGVVSNCPHCSQMMEPTGITRRLLSRQYCQVIWSLDMSAWSECQALLMTAVPVAPPEGNMSVSTW